MSPDAHTQHSMTPKRLRRLAVLIVVPVVVLAGCADSLRRPPKPERYGTRAEVGTRGDNGNPGALFGGEYPSDADTQEREVGGHPARFSGYTTWVDAVDRVPASELVDGYGGDYLRVRTRVFNRDTESQTLCACDFAVWSPTAGQRRADAVVLPTLGPSSTMGSGVAREGDVYLYVGAVEGPLYVVFKPMEELLTTNTAHGVWRVA